MKIAAVVAAALALAPAALALGGANTGWVGDGNVPAAYLASLPTIPNSTQAIAPIAACVGVGKGVQIVVPFVATKNGPSVQTPGEVQHASLYQTYTCTARVWMHGGTPGGAAPYTLWRSTATPHGKPGHGSVTFTTPVLVPHVG